MLRTHELAKRLLSFPDCPAMMDVSVDGLWYILPVQGIAQHEKHGVVIEYTESDDEETAHA